MRSRNQFVAGKQSANELAVHLSSAEGMYRSRNNPSSSDCLKSGKISPFATSARSLIDELNLSLDNFEIGDIACLSYFLDLKRAQPLFVFYLRVDMNIKKFFSIYSDIGSDIHENEAIFALPARFENLNKLFKRAPFFELNASYPDMYEDFFTINNSVKVRIASNHAKAGFASYALKDLGPITEKTVSYTHLTLPTICSV